MSSFAAIGIDARTTPFDALIAASGKCVEGPPGMGFVFARRSVLERCAGNSTSLSLDLYDQWTYMEKTTQWRYTPPTHVVVALRCGARPARSPRVVSPRASPATRRIAKRWSAASAKWASSCSSGRKIQAPIILTFHAPPDPGYNFKDFYARVRDKGFILYPGKLTQVETFRVGCIGADRPRRDAARRPRGARHAARDGNPAGATAAGGGAARRGLTVDDPRRGRRATARLMASARHQPGGAPGPCGGRLRKMHANEVAFDVPGPRKPVRPSI